MATERDFLKEIEDIANAAAGDVVKKDFIPRDIRRENSDRIITLLQEGKAPWQQEGIIPFMQINAVTYNAYSGMNQIMLGIGSAAHGGEDPRWCTYEQAQENGWHVKQGSHGEPVEYFNLTGDDQIKRLHYNVFHASQIAEIPEYQKQQGTEEQKKALEMVIDILKGSGVRIRHDQTDKAYYREATDTIHLPPPEKFGSLSSYCSTVLHEMAKWSGHQDRLNRGYGHARAVREDFRAELVSYQLSARLGLPFSHEYQKQQENYNEKLIELLKEDKNELARAARDAERATEYIMSYGLEQGQEQERKKTQTQGRGKGVQDKAQLDAAEREANYLASLERSHDRTHVAGYHINPNSPEATMMDAADNVRGNIQSVKREISEDGASTKAWTSKIHEMKEQSGKITQAVNESKLNKDIDSLKGNVYEELRDKIARGEITEEQAKEQDKALVIEDVQKESKSVQITEADSENRRRSYAGVMLVVGALYCAQQLSRDVVVLHDNQKLTQIPQQGQKISINYENGIGMAESVQAKVQGKDNSRSLSFP